jgi:hypothetical protein
VGKKTLLSVVQTVMRLVTDDTVKIQVFRDDNGAWNGKTRRRFEGSTTLQSAPRSFPEHLDHYEC